MSLKQPFDFQNRHKLRSDLRYDRGPPVESAGR
jgi:hypothetical protein